ncbi:hypothetical protein LPJ81_003662 [Coemansia sp. IMI 209127]|nr:hypothetical protein LPJ81_003662 [Coemansia sp. IMI 209127]
MAARVVPKESKRGMEQQVLRRQRGSVDEIVSGDADILDMALLDSDFENNVEAERSSEWSRNEFGYIEFRRMSLGKSSVLSLVGGESGARELGYVAPGSFSPLSSIVSNPADMFSEAITPRVLHRSSSRIMAGVNKN